VVSGNVWPELTTVGTVMRPMVSDMEGGEGSIECEAGAATSGCNRVRVLASEDQDEAGCRAFCPRPKTFRRFPCVLGSLNKKARDCAFHLNFALRAHAISGGTCEW
jgi:hypothetical protein